MRHLPVRLKQVRTDQCFRQRLGLQWTPAPAKVRQVTVSPACRPIDPISTGRLTWAPRTGAISGQPHGRTGLQSATREEITPAPDSGWLPGPQETRADRKRPPLRCRVCAPWFGHSKRRPLWRRDGSGPFPAIASWLAGMTK